MESRVVLYVLYHVTLNMYLRMGAQRHSEAEVSLHWTIFLFRKIILRSRIQESHQSNR